MRGKLAALDAYRSRLVEEQHWADLWEQEMVGLVEVLAALQERLDRGVTWEDKRAVVEMLVKGIVIETQTDEAGERYPVAHVTYRFEHPDLTEAPIPIELEPLFADVEVAQNWQKQGNGI